MRIDGIALSLRYSVPGSEPTTALAGATIRLADTGIHAVTGPSGCGKSSLLYVLSGLRLPTSGTVYYDDVDMQSFPADDRARLRRGKFGFIFQQHFLMDSLTAMDNVLIPLNRSDGESRKKAQELLALLGLDGLWRRKPHELSQGQRQRVAVARALVNNPEVIFADEPTAALDHDSTMGVMDLLAVKSRCASVLLITHDRELLERADRITHMKDGQILPHP